MSPRQDELTVRVGMPVSDLLKQELAQKRGLILSGSEPDFWGTDDPIAIRMQLPSGSVLLQQSDGRGVFIHTSPNSINGRHENISRIRSISIPILSKIYPVVDDFSKVGEFCSEIKIELGSTFIYDAGRSIDMSNSDIYSDSEKFNYCRFYSKDQYVTIGLERMTGDDYFLARLYAGEDFGSKQDS